MKFVVAITKDRQPRSFRVQIRPGYSQNPLTTSRAVASPSAARREAERLFGALNWQEPADRGVVQDYVVQVALVEATAL